MNNNRDPLYKVTNVLLLQMFRKSEVARASPSLLKRTTSATGNLPSELTRPHWIRAPRRVGVGGLPTWKTGRGRCYVLYRITKATRSPAVSNCSCALEKPTDPARCCCLPTLLLDQIFTTIVTFRYRYVIYPHYATLYSNGSTYDVLYGSIVQNKLLEIARKFIRLVENIDDPSFNAYALIVVDLAGWILPWFGIFTWTRICSTIFNGSEFSSK